MPPEDQEEQPTAEQPGADDHSMFAPKVDLSKGQKTVFYANFGQSGVSLFDIKLILSYVSGMRKDTGEFIAENTVEIAMSPEFAKTVLAHLTSALDKYEKAFGPLRLKPEHFQVS